MRVWIADRGAAYDGRRWRVVWIDPASRRERSRSFDLKRDAEAFRTSTEHSFRSGPYRDPEDARRTFAEAAAAWMESRRSIRDSTRDRDSEDLRRWVLPQWGGRQLGSIRREHVERWISQLSDGSAPRNYADPSRVSTGLSGRSVRAIHVTLSGTLSYAMRLGWIASNEAHGIDLPKPTDGPRVYLDFAQVEELGDLIGGAGTPSDVALIRLLAFAGLRIGEALSLQVGDVDLAARRIHVERTWTDSRGSIKLGPPKTGKDRRVPLHGFLTPEIAELVDGHAGTDWLFRASRGGPHHPNNWRERVWRKAIRGSVFEEMKLTPHGLRHTAASMAIASGADVLVVQTMLGHSSSTETLRTYAHLWPDRLDEVADRVSVARERALGQGVTALAA